MCVRVTLHIMDNKSADDLSFSAAHPLLNNTFSGHDVPLNLAHRRLHVLQGGGERVGAGQHRALTLIREESLCVGKNNNFAFYHTNVSWLEMASVNLALLLVSPDLLLLERWHNSVQPPFSQMRL